MKHKTIWILNHHATDMAFQHGGRHYYFAQYLIERGYKTIIFCASSLHEENKQAVDLKGNLSIEQSVDGIPFVFVKTRSYTGNGIKRVLSMFDYYFHVKKAVKKYDAPDVIIGSSVHPLACVAAINLSKRYQCKNIVEIRDLWPESIVEFMKISRNNPVIKFLFQLEKWMYRKADQLIFTMEGGYQYITDKHWENEITSTKVSYINNGVDLSDFIKSQEKSRCSNHLLDDSSLFKVLYTGSIRSGNGLNLLIDAAKILMGKQPSVHFLLFGDGTDRQQLEKRCEEEKISNVHFLGNVEKSMIPSILSQGDCNVLNYQNAGTWKYGGSQNKLFEYLASGKPIISNIKIEYSLIERYQCGIIASVDNAEAYAEAISDMFEMKGTTNYTIMCENARMVAKVYNYPELTKKLISVIEG
jgi:glycosyltransferase involved in cell wall biosynthesis